MQGREGKQAKGGNGAAARMRLANSWTTDLAAERMYKVAHAAIRRAIGSRATDREDLVQEVLERVLRSLYDDRFAGRSALSTWVTAIARHVVLEEIRATTRSRRPQGSPLRDIAEAATPVDLQHQLEARSALDRVQHLLEEMDPVTAEIIVLHELFGYELTELAALTALSVAAVQSRLVRGRSALVHGLRGEVD